MAALPDPPLMSVEEYLATSFPDGDREYLDGIVVERKLGTDPHGTLQIVLGGYLRAQAKRLGLAVKSEVRTRVAQSRYRVPDILVVRRPYRTVRGVIIDAPFLVVEILSPDDKRKESLERFRDYQALGVPHILQLDPVRRTALLFADGGLVPYTLDGFEVPGRGFLPFNSTDLLARLDR
jgi:Uma2 family endonuclease